MLLRFTSPYSTVRMNSAERVGYVVSDGCKNSRFSVTERPARLRKCSIGSRRDLTAFLFIVGIKMREKSPAPTPVNVRVTSGFHR
jgi:hypothetical protein